jgi:hypothetical protein
MPLSVASPTIEDQPQLKRNDTRLFRLILLKILGLEGWKPQRLESSWKEARFNIEAYIKNKVPSIFFSLV